MGRRTTRSVDADLDIVFDAVHLLQSGITFDVIAPWLRHESTTTTGRYVEAALAMIEKALAQLEALVIKMRRYRTPDALMRFLQML